MKSGLRQTQLWRNRQTNNLTWVTGSYKGWKWLLAMKWILVDSTCPTLTTLKEARTFLAFANYLLVGQLGIIFIASLRIFFYQWLIGAMSWLCFQTPAVVSLSCLRMFHSKIFGTHISGNSIQQLKNNIINVHWYFDSLLSRNICFCLMTLKVLSFVTYYIQIIMYDGCSSNKTKYLKNSTT